ncbi:MAG TPA: hypothetical protein PKH94_04160 [Bacteroidales bacterium]|nr:hypothetical protein [Bacteroidales bacterium]HNS46411.1 hypothetical protein [Bacteroidales bacterium]
MVTFQIPAGRLVTCGCTLVEIKGAKLTFAVSASDEKGMIGKGIHTRYIVDQEAFLKQAGL